MCIRDSPSVGRVLDRLLPTTSDEQLAVIQRLYEEAHYRAQHRIAVDATKFVALRDLLIAEGFDPEVGESLVVPGTQLDRDNATLVDNVASSLPVETLADVIPGNGLSGSSIVDNVRDRIASMSDNGWTPEARASEFETNQIELEERLANLPDDPGRSDARHFEAIEVLAYRQAELILNAETNHRDVLWGARSQITNGVNPGRFIRGGFEPRPTPFSELWNAAELEARAGYYGFDPVTWSLADPYIDLSKQMDSIHDDLEDWFRPLLTLVIGGVLFFATSGLASLAYGSILGGTAAAGFGTAFGAITGSYVSTFFLTGGSTSAAEKAAFRSLLTAGVAHYANVPVAGRTFAQHATVAVLEGGLNVLNDGDFIEGFLASLARNYVPGLGTFLEGLDNFSPFLADLATKLVQSFILNEGDWDKIGDDLQQLILEEAAGFVANFVGDALPESWGEIGTALAEIAGVTVISRGDLDTIVAAIAERAGRLIGQEVGNVFGDEEGEQGWQSQLAEKFVSVWIEAQLLPDEEQAGFIDRELTGFIFALAAEEISGGFESLLVANNNGQSTPLIEAGGRLIKTVITNLWKGEEAVIDAVSQLAQRELLGLLNQAFPSCAPDWLHGLSLQLADVALGIAFDGGDASDIAVGIGDSLQSTIDSGGIEIDGFGTCFQDPDTQPTDGEPTPATCGVQAAVGNVDPNRITVHKTSAAPKSAVLAIDEIDPNNGDGVCAAPSAFRDWLFGLEEADVRQYTVTTLNGAFYEVSIIPDYYPNGLDLSGYQLRIPAASNRGEIVALNGLFGPETTELVVYITRGDDLQINGFVGFEALYEQTTSAGRSTLDQIISFASGCGTAVGEFLSSIQTLILDLWNAESIGAYLTQKWAEFEKIYDAFRHNPAQFFEDFLRELVRLDLLEEDPDAWLGAIACDILLAVISGGVAGAGLRFAGVFVKAANGEIDAWRQSTSRDENSQIGSICNSFPGETQVLVADGSYSRIDEIRPGDYVISFNFDTSVWEPKLVVDHWSHAERGPPATATLVDQSTVTATHDHLFWVENTQEWTELDQVQSGDMLLTPQGEVTVENVTIGVDSDPWTVWDFTVQDNHNFTVSTGTADVLVHNAACAVTYTRLNGATVDDRYFSPYDGPGLLRVVADILPDSSRRYILGGVIQQGLSTAQRQGFELQYPLGGLIGLPGGGQYDRSHLVGPGGTGHEFGQILYSTANFNRGFMRTVEQQLQVGYNIAADRGWKLRYEITATGHRANEFGGQVLRNIEYRAWFDKPDGSTATWLEAFGAQDLPRLDADGVLQPGITTRADWDTFPGNAP